MCPELYCNWPVCNTLAGIKSKFSLGRIASDYDSVLSLNLVIISLFSCDLNVPFRGDIIRRNRMLATLGC